MNKLFKALDDNFRERAPKALDKLFLGDKMDVRRLFSLQSRIEQADQRIKVEQAGRADLQTEVDKLLSSVEDESQPIVAKMPNGDTYVVYYDSVSRYGRVAKVEAVNL